MRHKKVKQIKALTGITAQDKNQLLHRCFKLSQFLLLRKTLGKNPETPETTSIFPIFVDTTSKCDLRSSTYQHTKSYIYMKKSFCHCLSTKNLLIVLFFSLSGLTSDKPLEKSITNSRNEQFQILALPAVLLFQMFCNFLQYCTCTYGVISVAKIWKNNESKIIISKSLHQPLLPA